MTAVRLCHPQITASPDRPRVSKVWQALLIDPTPLTLRIQALRVHPKVTQEKRFTNSPTCDNVLPAGCNIDEIAHHQNWRFYPHGGIVPKRTAAAGYTTNTDDLKTCRLGVLTNARTLRLIKGFDPHTILILVERDVPGGLFVEKTCFVTESINV